MRVVLDTNIYISAIVFGGVCENLLDRLRLKRVEVLISAFILQEVKEVLEKKFKWKNEDVRLAIYDIEKRTTFIETKSKVNIIKKKKDDNHILECALDGRADLIITGDTKHILPLQNFRGIKIVTPRQFLK